MEKEKFNFTQKKIVYLNIVMLFVFICGLTLAIIGFTPIVEYQNHMIIIETFGVPMVTASLAYWSYETHCYLKIRDKQLNKDEKTIISHPAIDLAEWLASQGWEKKEDE